METLLSSTLADTGYLWIRITNCASSAWNYMSCITFLPKFIAIPFLSLLKTACPFSSPFHMVNLLGKHKEKLIPSPLAPW